MRVAGSVAVGRDLSGLAVDDETVWAASLGSGTVARVDARTRRVVGRSPSPQPEAGQPALL